jgi:hypothetical protein
MQRNDSRIVNGYHALGHGETMVKMENMRDYVFVERTLQYKSTGRGMHWRPDRKRLYQKGDGNWALATQHLFKQKIRASNCDVIWISI